jgi:hypothetical protein
MSSKMRQKKDGARRDKRNKSMREDVKARRAGDHAARPRTKSTGAPKSHKPGHQPQKPGRGEQARVGRHARKPSDTMYREGQADSLSGPSERVRRAASMRTGGTGSPKGG